MELNIASDADRKKWDSLVANTYGGSVFHTLKYLECLEKHTTTRLFNHQIKGALYPLVAREGAVIVALFPLFVYSFHGVRLVRSGNDREDLMYLGPVFIEGDTLKPSKLQIRALRLQKAVDHFLKRELKALSIHLSISPFYPDARPYLWSNYDILPLHTHFYYLERGPDALWADFNKGVRKVIQNAQKNHVSIEPGGLQEAGFIFDMLHARNRTNSSKDLVLALVNTLSPNNCNVFVAKKAGTIRSGVIVLHHGHYAHLWIGFPGSDTDYLGANELLMWELIKWAHVHGFQILENTGADDISTFQFKRKFNPTLKHYFKADGSSFFFRSYKWVKKLNHLSHSKLDTYDEKNEKT